MTRPWRVGIVIAALDLAGLGVLSYPGWRASSRFAEPPVEAAVPLDYGGGNEVVSGGPPSGAPRAGPHPLPPPNPSPAGERPPQAVWATREGVKAPSPPGILASDPRWRDLGLRRVTGYIPGAELRPDGSPTVGVPGRTCTAFYRDATLRQGDQVYVEGVGILTVQGRASRRCGLGGLDVAVSSVARAYAVTGPGRDQTRRVWVLDEEVGR